MVQHAGADAGQVDRVGMFEHIEAALSQADVEAATRALLAPRRLAQRPLGAAE